MEFENYTPHMIVLNNGTEYKPTWTIARVKVDFTEFDTNWICEQVFSNVEWLPEINKNESVKYIVSWMVLSALQWIRDDVVAPATGHPETIRNEKGHIISVPWFVS